jgi:eukaryotic-like serine/threonine-protein kinase
MAISNFKPGTVIGGRYRLERPLGHGAMGIVYLAKHLELGTKLAIKFLDQAASEHQETAERFRREGRAAVAIRHPGIVKMVDLDVTPDGVRFLVMEFLEGLTLDALCARAGALKPAVAAAVLVPMLDALEAAHAAGVIHRDLKPANVMLATAPNQAVKLLDFGISKVVKDPRLTTPGAAMGTPDYMAPEQTTDALAVTAAADLYSLGVIAFELLSGRVPFSAPNVAELMFKVLTEAPPGLATVVGELDPRLCELVDALLVKDPKARPQSAAGVRAALLAAVKPDPAALWALVKSPADAGLGPTFARPSPATPLELAKLAPQVAARPPPPELAPGPQTLNRKSSRGQQSAAQTLPAAAPRASAPRPAARPKSGAPWVVAGLGVAAALAGAAVWNARQPGPPPPAVVAVEPAPTQPPTPVPAPEPVEAPAPAPLAPRDLPSEPAPAPGASEPAKPTPRPRPPGPAAPKKQTEAERLIAAGHAAMKQDDFALARQKFTECKQRFPENPDCLPGLVQVLTTLGESTAAAREQRRWEGLRAR